MQMDNGMFLDPDRNLKEHQEICRKLASIENAVKIIRLWWSTVPYQLEIQCELPVVSNGMLLGFAEVLYRYKDCFGQENSVLIEVKSKMDDWNSLLRQLQTFRAILGDIRLVVIVTDSASYDEFAASEYKNIFQAGNVLVLSLDLVRSRIAELEGVFHKLLDSDPRAFIVPPTDGYNAALSNPRIDAKGRFCVALEVRWWEFAHWDRPLLTCTFALIFDQSTTGLTDLIQKLDIPSVSDYVSFYQKFGIHDGSTANIDDEDEDEELIMNYVDIDLMINGNKILLFLAEEREKVHVVPSQVDVVPGSLKVTWIRGEDKQDENEFNNPDDDREPEDMTYVFSPVLYDWSVWELGVD